MTLPSITTKTWTGESGEYFTFEDMARIESNLSMLAEVYGIPAQTFRTPTRAGQFYYDDAQKIDDAIDMMLVFLSRRLDDKPQWMAGRGISYKDFNRWESNIQELYDNAGDIGEGNTVVFEVPEALPSAWGWSFEDNGVTVASGNGIPEIFATRVPAGTLMFKLTAYGVTITKSVTVNGYTQLPLTNDLTKLTVSSTAGFSTASYNGVSVAGTAGTTAAFMVPRDGASHTVAVSVSEAPARLTFYPASGGSRLYDLWEYGSASGNVTPTQATASVSLTPARVGKEAWITESGTLDVPIAGNFDVWAVGGGNGGDNGEIINSTLIEANPNYVVYTKIRSSEGGNGGEIINYNGALARGNMGITIGVGGAAGGGVGGDTIITGILSKTAHGGQGAGAGGSTVTTHYLTQDGRLFRNRVGRPGKASQCKYCGGGGGGATRYAETNPPESGGAGGAGGSLAGAGGAGGKGISQGSTGTEYAQDGANGTILNGKGYGGAGARAMPDGSVTIWYQGGGGGGGGYGADGGFAGYASSGPEMCGGGGGGAMGGDGADAMVYAATGTTFTYGGIGYGAGGKPGIYAVGPQIFDWGGSGSGGGLGPLKITSDTLGETAGAPGAVLIKYLP